MACDHRAHTIHSAHSHYGWDNSNEPVLIASPGDTILFECQDAAGGHFTQQSASSDIESLDFGKVNPVTGPVYVEGSEPGDALKITIGEIEPSGFGWTANIPGFGLLADQFENPHLRLWTYDKTSVEPAAFATIGKVPLKPFIGTIGVAPAESGLHSIVPPRNVGGNMDVRDISTGTILYLPVEVAGGLLSIGDTHAAQGDGEVCGTAIESAMRVSLSVEVLKGAAPASPRFTTPGPVTRHLDAKGYAVTTGVGPDLMQASRESVSRMVDLLASEHDLMPEDAYLLCSVCGDLRISEIVDMPNWIVSFYFPRIVFD